MTRGKAKDFAAEIAPLIARLLAEELHTRLRPKLLIGDDCVVSGAEASQILTSSERTLEYWRARGIGPRSVKMGVRKIGYRLGALRSYIRGAERGSLLQQAPSYASKPTDRQRTS